MRFIVVLLAALVWLAKNHPHPFVHLLMEWRDLNHLLNNWVSKFCSDSFISDHKFGVAVPVGHAPHYRMHCQFMQCGAATGRITTQNPNLQAGPKAAFEFSPAVRKSLHQEIQEGGLSRLQQTIQAASKHDVDEEIRGEIACYVLTTTGSGLKSAELLSILENMCNEPYSPQDSQSLAAYWRAHGADFSDEWASRIRQVQMSETPRQIVCVNLCSSICTVAEIVAVELVELVEAVIEVVVVSVSEEMRQEKGCGSWCDRTCVRVNERVCTSASETF